MNPRLKMLLWKEWRERRGQLVLCLASVLGPATWAMFWSISNAVSHEHHSPLGLAGVWLVLYGMLMPIFVAMRTARGESTDRTASFSLGMPVSPRWANWIRLGGGAAVLAIPLLVLGILAPLVFAAVRYVDPPIARDVAQQLNWTISRAAVAGGSQPLVALELALLICGVAVIGCYAQLAMLGTLVRSENQMAFLGAVWTILWLFVAMIILQPSRRPDFNPIPWFSPHALMLLPFSDTRHGRPDHNPLVATTIINLVISLGIAAWFVHRQSRLLVRGAADAPRKLARFSRTSSGWTAAIGRPLPTSRIVSLVWLALRQALPMCLAGLVVGLALSVLMAYVDDRTANWEQAVQIFPITMSMVAVLWASIVGVGSVADELDRRGGDFWRTRPIPFWRLFAVKFLLGLVAVVLVLDGPALLVGRFGPPNLDPTHLQSPDWEWGYLACLVPLHVAMFALAVAWACWLRRIAVGAMAAVLSYAAFYLASLSFSPLRRFDPLAMYEKFLDVRRSQDPLDLAALGYPAMAVMLGLIVALSFWIAGRSLAAYQPRGRAD